MLTDKCLSMTRFYTVPLRLFLMCFKYAHELAGSSDLQICKQRAIHNDIDSIQFEQSLVQDSRSLNRCRSSLTYAFAFQTTKRTQLTCLPPDGTLTFKFKSYVYDNPKSYYITTLPIKVLNIRQYRYITDIIIKILSCPVQTLLSQPGQI